MGGSVAVTLREPDGTEHRMCRWTNPLPWFINNMKFINKDPVHIKQWLDRWNEMRADWEKNKGTGKFEFPMTEAYAPSPYLAPMGYGLVVIDMKKNVILNCQGYCNFGVIHGVSIALDMNPNVISGDKPEDRDKEIAKAFFDANRAVVWKWVKGVTKKRRGQFLTTQIGYQELLLILKKNNEMLDIRLDMHPFKIQDYSEESASWPKMRADIEKLGFKITAEEDKMWDEWLKERKEMEE